MTANTLYQDLSSDFDIHPVSGDLLMLTEGDAVRRAVRNLVLTGIGERVDDPDIGSGVRRLLFEPMTALTALQLQREIETCIRNYEPRVTSLAVTCLPEPDANRFSATVNFQIASSNEVFQVDVFLDRIR